MTFRVDRFVSEENVIVLHVSGRVGTPAHDENIRRRAYEICLERGGQPGRELDDWLKAERELEM
jgi:hypothetical protein